METALAQQRCVQFFKDHGFPDRDHDEVLLEETLTHKSFAADFPHLALRHNERVEFLGDALLGAIIANRLREDYPDQSEAELTLKKIYLIKEPTLATVARSIGLGDRIRLGKGEEKSGGRGKDSILADACEAWIAYLWRQFGWEVVNCFVITYIYPLRMDSGAVRGKSYKSLLQERAQKTYQQLPVYVEDAVQVEHSGNVLRYRSVVTVDDTVLAEARATNKRKAQEEAAKLAYEKVSGPEHSTK